MDISADRPSARIGGTAIKPFVHLLPPLSMNCKIGKSILASAFGIVPSTLAPSTFLSILLLALQVNLCLAVEDSSWLLCL